MGPIGILIEKNLLNHYDPLKKKRDVSFPFKRNIWLAWYSLSFYLSGLLKYEFCWIFSNYFRLTIEFEVIISHSYNWPLIILCRTFFLIRWLFSLFVISLVIYTGDDINSFFLDALPLFKLQRCADSVFVWERMFLIIVILISFI